MLASGFLSMGDGARGPGEFETIVTLQGCEPRSPLYPLARLGLARAYRRERNPPASRRAYETFLSASEASPGRFGLTWLATGGGTPLTHI
jgi:hypothetical protein